MAAKNPQAQPQWMTQPQAPVGCPPGLEYLTQIDQLLVQQQVELLECSSNSLNTALTYLLKYIFPLNTVLTGCETRNKYRILNSVGQQVYFAQEGTKLFAKHA